MIDKRKLIELFCSFHVESSLSTVEWSDIDVFCEENGISDPDEQDEVLDLLNSVKFNLELKE